MAINLQKGPIPSDIRTRGKSNPEAANAAAALVSGDMDYVVTTGAESLSGKEKTESARKEAAQIVKALDKLGFTSHTSYSKSAGGVVVTLGEKMATEDNGSEAKTSDTSKSTTSKAA